MCWGLTRETGEDGFAGQRCQLVSAHTIGPGINHPFPIVPQGKHKGPRPPDRPPITHAMANPLS